MKHIVFILFLSTLGAQAQWTQDFSVAKDEAAATEKVIFALFTGSDWCPPCQQLERTVFSSSSFFKKGSDHAVFFMADFPRRKNQASTLRQQNEQLAKQYGIRSFPTMLILKADGTRLHKVGGSRTESNILKQIHKTHSTRMLPPMWLLAGGGLLLILVLLGLASSLLLRSNAKSSSSSTGIDLDIPDPDHHLVYFGHSASPYQIQGDQLLIDGMALSLRGARFISDDTAQLASGTQLRFVPVS